jgi:hypothetical protein
VPSFRPLGEFLDSGLILPIDGVRYRVEAPSVTAVLQVYRDLFDDDFERTRDSELVHIALILGNAWKHMIDDGVPEALAIRAGQAALAVYTAGADVAITYWSTGRFDTDPEPAVVSTDPFDDSAPGTYGAHDPGGGPYRAEYGDREWYNPPNFAPAFRNEPRPGAVTWRDILGHWNALEMDLQQMGIDLEGVAGYRSWRWFEIRIHELIANPRSRLKRAIENGAS